MPKTKHQDDLFEELPTKKRKLMDSEPEQQSEAESEKEICGIRELNQESIGLTDQDIKRFQREYNLDQANKTIQNALAEMPLSALVINRNRSRQINYVYNNVLKKQPRATNQQHSGRCWMFAALNMIRLPMMEKYDLDNFEFSEAYLFFWDKLERANWILELMIHLKDKSDSDPIDNRMLSYYLSGNTHILEDGGYWYHFRNLVDKYGLMPKTNYDECYNTMDTTEMNEILKVKVSEYSCKLNKSKNVDEALHQEKLQYMSEFYGLLVKFLGEPPKKFHWQYYDQNHHYSELKDLTPLSFYRIHVPFDVDSKVILVHDPRPKNPYYAHYIVDYFANMIKGMPNIHFNFPISRIKKYVADSIKNNEAVWFCCDVGKCFDPYRNVLDTKLFDYEQGLNIDFDMSKAERLCYGASGPTHAMLITGVDEASPGKYRKWRVENSWGAYTDNQDMEDPLKGYILMSDDYFEKYLFCVAIDPKYISEQDAKKMANHPETIILQKSDESSDKLIHNLSFYVLENIEFFYVFEKPIFFENNQYSSTYEQFP
jgi:bleomycin hydrolase